MPFFTNNIHGCKNRWRIATVLLAVLVLAVPKLGAEAPGKALRELAEENAKLRQQAEADKRELARLQAENAKPKTDPAIEQEQANAELKKQAEADKQRLKKQQAETKRQAEQAAKKQRAEQDAVLPKQAEALEQPHLEAPLIAGRYRDNGDGTVTDITTGLHWMRCTLGQTWQVGSCRGEAPRYTVYTWSEALEAAEDYRYAGYTDWKLPSKDELLSLVFCSTGKPKTWNSTGDSCEGDYQWPTIIAEAFPDTPDRWFWSSSPVAAANAGAWIVNFGFGYDGRDDKDSNYAVRLVRSGQ